MDGTTGTSLTGDTHIPRCASIFKGDTIHQDTPTVKINYPNTVQKFFCHTTCTDMTSIM